MQAARRAPGDAVRRAHSRPGRLTRELDDAVGTAAEPPDRSSPRAPRSPLALRPREGSSRSPPARAGGPGPSSDGPRRSDRPRCQREPPAADAPRRRCPRRRWSPAGRRAAAPDERSRMLWRRRGAMCAAPTPAAPTDAHAARTPVGRRARRQRVRPRGARTLTEACVSPRPALPRAPPARPAGAPVGRRARDAASNLRSSARRRACRPRQAALRISRRRVASAAAGRSG